MLLISPADVRHFSCCHWQVTTDHDESKQPLTAKEMIEGGPAPAARHRRPHTYSAILREINHKGKDARFKKTERGKLALNG